MTTDAIEDGGEYRDSEVQHVRGVLSEQFGDVVFCVESDVVWVSGMNAHCVTLARRMARSLSVCHDVPCGLVYDDGLGMHGGVQFNWGEDA